MTKENPATGSQLGVAATNMEGKEDDPEEAELESTPLLGIPKDSLHALPSHVSEKNKINYEKVCPMKKCQNRHVDSFMQSLPSYMKASPFMHYEQILDGYEICSPEQLAILKQNIEENKKKKRLENYMPEEDVLEEWGQELDGVGVQTSLESLPPCTCIVPSPTPVSSVGKIFDVTDLVPFKHILDEIRKEHFFDETIEFNRFKVVGQEHQEE
ncbi:hypothetical protein ACJJTC_014193 [Scirpophaga incertulas]